MWKSIIWCTDGIDTIYWIGIYENFHYGDEVKIPNDKLRDVGYICRVIVSLNEQQQDTINLLISRKAT